MDDQHRRDDGMTQRRKVLVPDSAHGTNPASAALAGFEAVTVKGNAHGLVDLDDLKRAIDDKTILVTIMAANNEIGVLQPIAEIGKLCHERGVIFHTDAVQAIGKVPVDVNTDEFDPADLPRMLVGYDIGFWCK